MTTDKATDLESRCVLVSVAYLERNDFKSIRHVSRHVIRAKDGRKEVYVWISVGKKQVAVPVELFHIAKLDDARVDVLSFQPAGDRAEIKHIMNVTMP